MYGGDEPTDNKIIIVDCSDSENEALKSRFQHKNKPATLQQDTTTRYCPGLDHTEGEERNAKTRTKKRVTLDLVVSQLCFSSANFNKCSCVWGESTRYNSQGGLECL